MGNGIKNPRLTKNWHKLPANHKPLNDREDPFLPGQQLVVKVDDGLHGFIPCFTKSSKKGKETIARIPNMEWVTYLSLVEIEGQQLMEFLYKENTVVLIGFGALPYLVNIPKKRARRRRIKRKKPGSPRPTQKRKSKSPGAKRRKNKHMKPAELPGENDPDSPEEL